MALPQSVIDSYWTTHSYANGARMTNAGSPQQIAEWAASMGLITPAQAAAEGGQSVTQTPVTSVSGSSAGSTGGASSAGNAGGTGGMGSSTPTSNAGFSTLTPVPGGQQGVSINDPINGPTLTSTVTTPTPPPTNPPATGTTGTPSVGSTASGFSGLTGNAAGTGTANPSVTSNPNATVTGTSGAVVSGANSQKLGSNAYGTLLSTYQTIYPGAQVSTPEGQQMFNQWVDGIRQQTGAQTMEDIPITFSQGMAANSTQGGPGGPGTAVVPANANYQQNQNASQSGGFTTTGATNTQQNQVTGQNTATQGASSTQGTQQGQTSTTGSQQQTGGQTSTTGTTGTTTGTSTVAPTDALGFGALLKNAATGAVGNDATRNAFLTDVVNTGGSQFGSQVDQAIRNSLTGPQMTGAGDSARARASGYAAAEVGRNNLSQRLAAAQELAAPGSVASLAGAAAPYGVGSTTSNTGTTAQQGTSTGTNFSNLVSNENVNSLIHNLTNQQTSGNTAQTGFSNLTGSQNETQQGTATGNSSQSAAGVIPQTQTVNTGGGGCVLCTAAVELGLFNNLRVLRKVIDHKLRVDRSSYRSAARGYFALFTPLARALLRYPRLAALLYPLARAVVYEELRVAGRRLPVRKWAAFVHWTGHALCHVVGKLPVSGVVRDPVIESIARKHNIWFSLS